MSAVFVGLIGHLLVVALHVVRNLLLYSNSLVNKIINLLHLIVSEFFKSSIYRQYWLHTKYDSESRTRGAHMNGTI